MPLTDIAYEAMKSVVGEDYVSRDPEVCKAYSRGGFGQDLYDVGRLDAACVVLPGNTEEVQAIIKLANRYQFPYIPASTRFIAFCSPVVPDTVMVHLKRMDRLQIDAQNQVAIVEPYVIYSQLQIEAMKLGLYTCPTLAGAQISVLANHLTFGMGPLSYRASYAIRRILALEWVLPNGELLRTGSWSNPSADGFWGEGPGPDLRGLSRGYTGVLGGLGIVTRMAVKLFALPKPMVPEPCGITPRTTFALDPKYVRWYNMGYKTPRESVEGIYKICQAEVCCAVMRVPTMWRALRKAVSKEEFWQLYERDKEKWEKTKPNIVRMGIIGFTSPKQTEYEERVLQDLAQETGGTLARVPDTGAADTFQPSYANCAFRPGNYFTSEKLGFDSIDHGLIDLVEGMKVKRKYYPVLVDDAEEAGWILEFDFGHQAHCEMTSFHDSTPEAMAQVFRHEFDSVSQDMKIGAYTGFQYGPNHDFTGPYMGGYQKWLKKIKLALDKNNLSNPGRFVPLDPSRETPDSYYHQMKRLWEKDRKGKKARKR
ncbi:MAG: FAD-binding oxidoreductase [Chloroflexota bacterium]